MRKILIMFCFAIIYGTAHADTETIRWYLNDNLYDTTTCESGGDIILPTTPPTKYGYTFAGWAQTYDLSTLNKNTSGNVFYAIDNTGTCYYRTSSMSSSSTMSCSDANYSDLSAGKWKTEFSYGTVYGDSKCSSTSGTYATSGNPVDTAGEYCWCRATGFIPDGENFMYAPTVLLWVFSDAYGSASACAPDCTRNCGYHARAHSGFRSGLFGGGAN